MLTPVNWGPESCWTSIFSYWTFPLIAAPITLARKNSNRNVGIWTKIEEFGRVFKNAEVLGQFCLPVFLLWYNFLMIILIKYTDSRPLNPDHLLHQPLALYARVTAPANQNLQHCNLIDSSKTTTPYTYDHRLSIITCSSPQCDCCDRQLSEVSVQNCHC